MEVIGMPPSPGGAGALRTRHTRRLRRVGPALSTLLVSEPSLEDPLHCSHRKSPWRHIHWRRLVTNVGVLMSLPFGCG